MGVYIKGMAMPTNCYNCPFLDYEEGFCFASGVKHEDGWYESTLCPGGIKDKRHEECPLIPVPPHGRLIDGTDLYAILDGGFDVDLDELPETKDALLSMIQMADTIIEAEEKSDG